MSMRGYMESRDRLQAGPFDFLLMHVQHTLAGAAYLLGGHSTLLFSPDFSHFGFKFF